MFCMRRFLIFFLFFLRFILDFFCNLFMTAHEKELHYFKIVIRKSKLSKTAVILVNAISKWYLEFYF